jgi:hypothetical protein
MLAFTVYFLAFMESDNRRENSQSRPFFCAEKLTRFARRGSPRVKAANGWTMSAGRDFCPRHCHLRSQQTINVPP